jgi:transposase
MRYFAGLDMSLEETAICVVDETGLIMKEARAASEPEALDTLLSSLGLPLERLGLETCSLTAWLHGELKPPGGRRSASSRERLSGHGRHAERD